MKEYIRNFSAIDMNDLSKVGGKNASLGEMFSKLTPKGIPVPDGFAITAGAYLDFTAQNKLDDPLHDILEKLDQKTFFNLHETGEKARQLILSVSLPDDLIALIKSAYHQLMERTGGETSVAVRSSAVAEDLPSASFAGQLESYLNIRGEDELVRAVQWCYTSLYTDRAIKYRIDKGFSNLNLAISVGVQKMVRADLASSGVAFTLDPDTGFDRVVLINSIFGLGENIVQGRCTPDEFLVFKPHIGTRYNPIIQHRTGSKEWTMIYADRLVSKKAVENISTPEDKKNLLSLSDEEVLKLAKYCVQIEKHYGRPMDIEWAKDGESGGLFILQARPETVHAGKKKNMVQTYSIQEKGKKLAKGIALGNKIAAGKARLLASPADAGKLGAGEVLVTDITNPDWDPIMKKAAAIVTNKGGRTSHAAIVARELGIVAVVGSGNATEMIKDGEMVTVSCAEGKTGFIYDGLAKWSVTEKDVSAIRMPATEPMLILGDPSRAFEYSFLPNRGVGLLRLEFMITHNIQVHPLAITRFSQLKSRNDRKMIRELTRGWKNREDYFVQKLAEGVATIAAAFHPYDVIVRMSDFKSNEYANLIGGKTFEPSEENPMLGFRGASRYYNPLYKDGFMLECRAMKKVREEMGFENVKLMIPFCRTLQEAENVISVMEEGGLKRGEKGLELYMMVEIPSNVLMAEKFADLFDGFSIGSNDLTQLTLGLDRDSALISGLFNEKNPAVMQLIAQVIHTARKKQVKIGLCGQAPSDMPDFARFLVEQGIDSISFNADALLRGMENMAKAEESLHGETRETRVKKPGLLPFEAVKLLEE